MRVGPRRENNPNVFFSVVLDWRAILPFSTFSFLLLLVVVVVVVVVPT